jgi:iron complex outermembrane receptor protein
MKSLTLLIAGLLLVLAGFSSPVFAQDENEGQGSTLSDDLIDLGMLYVEDTMLGQYDLLDRPTAFASVLDPREIAMRSMTLADALETSPGISVRDFGGMGSLSTISIRGAGSRNVLVLLDGVPLNPTGGVVNLSDIPLNSLERIEIVRGGESAFYGPGAAGGVVRLTSLKPVPEESGGVAHGSIGSFDTASADLTLRSPEHLFHMEAAGSRGDFSFLNDNGTSFDSGDDFPDTRENNESTAFETRATSTWDLSPDSNLTVSGEIYRSNKGIPGIITFPSEHADQTDTRVFLNGFYTAPLGDGNLSMSLAWLRQGRFFSDPLGESTGVPLFSSWISNRWDLNCDWVGQGFGESDVATLGTDIGLERLTGSDYSPAARNLSALSVRDEWYFLSGAVAEGALRMDVLDGDFILNPRIGVKYPITESWVAQSNLGLDFRPPSFEELYRNEGLVVGNPDLASERSLGFDLGLTHTSRDVHFEAVYFNIQTRDLIDYLLISGFRWKPYNIGRSRSSGYELSVDWAISEEVSIRGNFTRTRALDISGDPSRQGKPLVGQPSSDFFAEIRWTSDPWTAFFNWERQGPSPITPSGTRWLPADNTAGLGVGYAFQGGSSIVIEARNLFDRSLMDVRGFPLPGRSFFITWTGEW